LKDNTQIADYSTEWRIFLINKFGIEYYQALEHHLLKDYQEAKENIVTKR